MLPQSYIEVLKVPEVLNDDTALAWHSLLLLSHFFLEIGRT